MNNSQSQTIVAGGPLIEEWALINKYKGREQQKMKQIKKQEQYEKMMRFRSGLDEQVKNKRDIKKIEKDHDNQYYKYVLSQEKQLHEREERDKSNRMKKRKQIEFLNSQTSQQFHSKDKIKDSGYHLEIGVKSEEQFKQREKKGKKQMVQGLEYQVKYKNEESKLKKIEDHYLNLSHQKNQQEQFDRHTIVKTKQYKQNYNIYNQFEKLLEEKRNQQKELQRKLIDEAASQQRQKERKRKYNEQKKRSDLTIDMKDTLAQQVKIHDRKKMEEKMSNPEDSSFEFINEVFRDKPPTYNKSQYFSDLKVQASQQKSMKRTQNMMSEEEYKINRNQLSKIISGEYARSNYLDRSLGAIGENRRATSTLAMADDPNSKMVKSRLDGIKTKNEDYLSRIEG